MSANEENGVSADEGQQLKINGTGECVKRSEVVVDCNKEKEIQLKLPKAEIEMNKVPEAGVESAPGKNQKEVTVHQGYEEKENATVSSACQMSNTDTNLLLNHKLQTIATYKNLVVNHKTHSLLLQEVTVSGFLVLCLGDDDPDVVEASMGVFIALAKQQDNLPILKNLNYFMDALRCVGTNKHVKDTLRADAKNLISELKSPRAEPNMNGHLQQPLTELSESMRNMMLPNSTTTNGSTGCMKGGGDKPPLRNPLDTNTTMMSTMKRKNKGRETILFVEGDILQKKSERTKITQALIGVPGIISVTYDLKKNHSIVRGKRTVASEVFGRAVADLALANVYLVRKDENKEEVHLHMVGNGKENIQCPPYPEEVESEEVDNTAAVATQEHLNAEGTTFLKSAKNFIKRSFYW